MMHWRLWITPGGVEVASSRAQEICLGLSAQPSLRHFLPRRLAPVVVGATGNWFTEASTTAIPTWPRWQHRQGRRHARAMVTTFNSLELMIGQLGTKGLARTP
uniref:Uncharacterized protein n=1 Tax=Ditylenchus dipsaci TaxID=166011 RepID=A0A915DS12_9BILA